MSSCARIPRKQALEAVRRTAETGNEHGFAVCADGTVTEIVEGESDRLKLKIGEDCPKPVKVFHTHPNGVTRLSEQDMSVLAAEEIDSVCAANADPDDPRYRCERVEACEVGL